MIQHADFHTAMILPLSKSNYWWSCAWYGTSEEFHLRSCTGVARNSLWLTKIHKESVLYCGNFTCQDVQVTSRYKHPQATRLPHGSASCTRTESPNSCLGLPKSLRLVATKICPGILLSSRLRPMLSWALVSSPVQAVQVEDIFSGFQWKFPASESQKDSKGLNISEANYAS